MSTGCIFVAMSGGVDSSVAAAILKAQGHDVRGITCMLFPGQTDSVSYAQAVARFLHIPHEVLDLTAPFAQHVTEPFCHAYHTGFTPNPCIDCNRHIKFGALWDYARMQGAARLATGHYARIVRTEAYQLLKAVDQAKDQSYFLYTLTQPQLEAALFPLGEMTKAMVRQTAVSLGLTKFIRQEESQDICFIPNGNYASFVTGYLQARPGQIVDTDGRVLGKHCGLVGYTIGQRKGLGSLAEVPLYVVKLDALRNQIVVGPKEALYRTELTARDLCWISGQPPSCLAGITARVRLKSPEAVTYIAVSPDTLQVKFSTPQWAVTPGQSIVFYRGDEVLGGGIIDDSLMHKTEMAELFP
ncbi:MAG: tRNA 2-thiouridine(34) synthase MnmA [Dehalococcoidia bacterium]|nr:tRNA 2-thiouridine(34) synthase MnmA [Dehalococcoidia bacterium]